jgi:hypothetical protein
MGAEAAGGGVRPGTPAAVLLAGYVAGLTVLARGETGSRSTRAVAGGAALAGAALVAMALRGGSRSVPWVAGAVALAAPAVVGAVGNPTPSRVGPAVGAMIRAIPAIDGALAAPSAPVRALAMLPLLALARWGRRLIPIH